VANTLFTALREGLYQSPELALIRLDLDEVPTDPAAFGREYRIAAVLKGEIVQESGGKRIGIELLDAGRDDVLWSQDFEWDPTRIMDIGTAIANGVLEAMELPKLSRQKFTGTDNLEAYEAVLLGWDQVASYKVEDVALAMESFQRAIDLDPGYVLAYVDLAWASYVYKRIKGPAEPERQSLDKRARRALEAALALDNESAAVISLLGQMTENPELRVQLWERALELDPNHAQTYIRLGMQVRSDGKLEQAERLFRKSLELNPMDASDRHNLGVLLWEMGRTGEAVTEIQKAVELEPEMPHNHRMLGIIELFSFGRYDNAIIHGRKAYSLDSQSGSMAGFLAVSYAELGARKQALAWIERSLQLSPTSLWTLDMAFLTHLTLGDEDMALEYAERNLELYPWNRNPLFFLGKQDIDAGRTQLALDRWQSAYPVLATGEDPLCDQSNHDWLVPYADILLQAGQTERARRLLKSCLPAIEQMKNKVSPEASQSRILALLGRKEEALEALRREIIDGHRRIEASFRFGQPEYDFLRNEPEFQRLMQIVSTDLARQLERVLEMERNGELAPAPGVYLPDS
jgi:tetratricopeptide (TPR) repeat protein